MSACVQPVCGWRCSPLSELSFGPSTYPLLPPLCSTPTHCVAIRTDTISGLAPPIPYPPSFKDAWDSEHIRMPCSIKSLYPGVNGLDQKWDLVKKALTKPIRNHHELQQAILSYNTRFSRRWDFKQLHYYFTEHASVQSTERFYTDVLPKMVDLVLSLPKVVTHAIPLLRKQQAYSLTLSQHQIACLLANAFFCTFPRRNSYATDSEYANFPSINFNTLFNGRQFNAKKMNKMDCILNYFRRVTATPPTGNVTFTRQVCKTRPKWEDCDEGFTKLHITSEGTIEDNGHGMLQVDFANKYIGGGVLSHGCVQEEIRFLISPELLVSRLFTEALDETESLLITGSERYSSYSGYASTFQWSGDYVDQAITDEWGRRQIQVVAIDALVFRGSGKAQFKPGVMNRELNKAYSGFVSQHSTPSGKVGAVATGNWGCGAFGGDPHLKGILQWMAASVALRDVVYFTFEKTELLDEMSEMHAIISSKDAKVNTVWKLLVKYYNCVIKEKLDTPLVVFMKQNLK